MLENVRGRYSIPVVASQLEVVCVKQSDVPTIRPLHEHVITF